MAKKIKIGIVGVGNIAETHLAAYLKNPDVEIYSFCDINEENLKEKAEKYGITRTYTNVEDMVKDPELDAVSVTTWNNGHASCTIAALNAGKHVLCEKPMALNAKLAEEMKEAAEKNGKLLQIGFVRRYGNDCEIVKDFVEKDYFGDIYFAKAQYTRRNGAPGGWFCDKARSGGGSLIDLGVHVIDFIRYVTGNPKPVSVYGITEHRLGDMEGVKVSGKYRAVDAATSKTFDVDDFASAFIKFDNGMTLHVETSFSLHTKAGSGKMELFGTKGGAVMNPDLELYRIENGFMTNTVLDYPTAFDFNGIFEREINHFVDCIQNGTKCIAPADDGIALMKILDAIYESAATGKEVTIK